MIRLSSAFALAALVSLAACKDDPAADGGETGTAETGTAETGTTETGGEVDCSDRPLEVPSSRSEIEGVWDAARGRMLVFAGDQGTPVSCMSQTDFVAEVWAFHTDCNNFERLEPGAGLTPRGRYALAHDAARERVLIHGGRWRAGTSGAYTVLDDLWAYELSTDTWTALPAGATPRSNHIAAVVTGDRLVIHGGNESTDGLSFTPLGDTWVFDLASESWSQLMTTGDPSPRLFHAAAASADTVYMFGGGDENAFLGPFFNDLWALDVQSATWTMLDDGQSGPPGFTASDLVYDEQGQRLLLWGGHDDTELGSRNTVWSYELGGGWSELELGDVYNAPAAGFCDFPADFVVPDLDAPERRHAGAAVLSDAGELIVFGGKTDCGQINDVWSWSLGDGTWTERSAATVGEICLRSFANCQSLCF